MSKYISNAFQIPNAVVDDLMSIMSPNAFKCYVLVVRKTTGWGKNSDKISISQFMQISGIKKRDTVIAALAELEKLNLILPVKKAGFVNEFRLNQLPKIDAEPVPKMGTGTSPENGDYPNNGTSPEKWTRVVPKMGTGTSPENGDTQNPIQNPLRQNTHILPQNTDGKKDNFADALVAADAATPIRGNDGLQTKTKRSRKASDVPFAEIVAAYNDTLGNRLPKAQMLSDQRKRAIASRWDEMIGSCTPSGKVRFTDRDSGIAWFGAFFRKARLNAFWMGDNASGFAISFDWIFKPANFLKILEWVPATQGAAS